MSEISIDQQFLLTSNDFVKSRDYWIQQLENSSPDKTVSLVESCKPSNVKRTYSFTLDDAIAKRLMTLCRNNDLSAYIYIVTAYSILHYKYTGSGNACVASPLFAKSFNELPYSYNKLLPVLASVNASASFKDLLMQVRNNVLDAAKHQHYPLRKVYEAVGITSISELADASISLGQLHLNSGGDDAELPLSIRVELSKEISFEIISAVHTSFAIEQLFLHLQQVIKLSLDDINISVGHLSLLTEADLDKLSSFNTTSLDYARNKSIMQVFAARVEETPDAVAIVSGDNKLTYRELSERAGRVAACLIARGIEQGEHVGLLSYRGIDMIAAMLGIVQAGTVYVPFNTGYPAERLEYIIENAGISYVLYTDEELLYKCGLQNHRIISIEECLLHEPSKVIAECNAHAGVYIMYTSGTTGNPKGILVNQQNILKLVYDAGEIAVNQDDVVIQWSNYSFDGSTYEIYSALLKGAKLCMIADSAAADVYEIARVIEDQGVTIFFITTALFNSFVDTELGVLKGLRKILFGGEMCSMDHVKKALRVLGPGKIIHVYGPTETTVYATSYPLYELGTWSTLPIGRPLSNTEIVLLNADQQEVPVGVLGELYIGGEGVSLGYVNNQELTEQKFVTINGREGKWYRTGDFGRWLNDGSIEFFGRKDDQVKIRGYRIELGEIESVLRQAEGISQCVVMAKTDKQGEKRLIGYIVPANGYNKEEVTNYLKTKLPEYMVPSMLVEMESIPLNSSGKVDRKKLPDPETAVANNENIYVAPANETEEKLALIWQELLGLERAGRNDNFFELGGHSLIAIQVIAAIRRELGIEVAIKDIFDHPSIAELAARLGTEGDKNILPQIERAVRSHHIPLSFSQERLWFIDRLQGSVQYHMPWVFNLNGTLNIDALKQSFKTIVNRHEILRTVIREENGRSYQQVMPSEMWRMECVTEEWILAAGETAGSYIQQHVNRAYDLSKDFMLRVCLVTLAPGNYKMSVVLHHIAFDGLSISIMVQELAELYNSYVAGNEPRLSELAIQYADYAIWQRNYLTGETLESSLSFWKEKLDALEPLQLPTDHSRPAQQSINGAVVNKLLDSELYQSLSTLSQRSGATLFMTLLSAFKILLHRYTGQSDICIGTPVAGRQQKEVENLLGFFVNTLALRSDVQNDVSYTRFLQQVRQTTLNAYAHQQIPFEKIVEALGVERDLSRTPVFQVMFGLQNMAIGQLRLRDVELSLDHNEYNTVQFDLNCSVYESENGLQISLGYCTDLFEEQTIERMLSHYENLLHAIVQDDETSIADLPMLSAAEENQLLLEFNNTERNYPKDKTIVTLIEEQAVRTPGAIAVVFEETKLSYAELDMRSNQMAHYLHSKGVKTETLVPVCIDRSVEMIIAILGILKAGGAYVPIDTLYPTARIQYMLEDIKAGVVITSNAHRYLFSSSRDAFIICIDKESAMIDSESTEKLNCTLQPSNLAYVIYTSGSTGTPKGVMNEHAGVVNRLLWTQEQYNLSATDAVLQKTTFCFDVSVWELFWPLIAGAKLVFAQPGKQGDSTYLTSAIHQNAITTIHFVPSMLQAFLEDVETGECATLQRVLCSGEALKPEHVRLFKEKLPHVELHNLYGPTEAAVDVTYWCAPGHFTGSRVPIGRPVSNTQLYIFDKAGKLVPVGVPGELYIGGAQVARGYLNRDELTKERFMQRPSTTLGTGTRPSTALRVYKTGDLARWLPDGNIEYLGRIDEQVKIRGFRIELGEIENTLQQAPDISQCVVAVNEDKNGNKRLIAYVVTNEKFNKDEAISWLQARLPDYMIPAIFIQLAEIPLSANGKVNRKNLPQPGAAHIEKEYVAPRNTIEEHLAEAWQQTLGVQRAGIHDNFFESGGDSIVSIQFISRLKRYGYELQPRDLFLYQTIAKLSAVLQERKILVDEIQGEQGTLTGDSGLLPVQKMYFEREPQNLSQYNQSILLGIDKSIKKNVLQQAIQLMVSQHDSLRFKYTRTTSVWQQTYGVYEGTLEVEDLRAIPAGSLAEFIEDYSEKYQRSLDIEKGELTRFVLVLTPDTETHNRLLVIVHHLAIDGVSWRILLEDLEHLLTAKNASLPAKTSSYRQWYNALVKYSESKRLMVQQAHWNKAVQSYQPLKVEKIYDDVLRVSDMGVHKISLDASRTRGLLQEASQAYRTEINDILLACLSKILCRWNDPDSYRDKIVIGLEGHGREAVIEGVDVSRTTGWFTTLYPVLLELPETNNNGKLLKSVKEQLRSIPDKGIGYGVLRYINKETSLSREPWDVVFNYLGQSDNVVNRSKCFIAATEPTGNTLHENAVWTNKLEINSIVSGGELVITWNYSNRHFEASTIELLAKEYVNTLEEMIEHCVHQSKESVQSTPSDYHLHGINYEDFDQFLQENINGVPRKNIIESIYRLSGLQEGILFHGLYDKSGGAYMQQVSFTLTGVNLHAFTESWNELLKKHSILRTGFYHDVFPMPVQCVYKEAKMPVEILDYRGLPGDKQSEKIKEYEAADLHRGFDFTCPPLMRIALMQLDEERYRMLWTMHHLPMDGWSMPVLIEEFMQLYDSLVLRKPVPPLNDDQYADYIRYIGQIDQDKEEQHWRSSLENVNAGTLLPFISSKAERTKTVGEFREDTLSISPSLTEKIEKYAQAHRITVNTIMQGTWSYILHRYTGEADIVFGVTVSGRPAALPRVEERVGMYINAIPLRSTLDEANVVPAWLKSLQEAQLKSSEYQYTSLSNIQRWIGIHGDLFDSIMMFQNFPVSKLVNERQWQLQVSDLKVYEPTSNYPFSIKVILDEGINIQFAYKEELLRADYVSMIKQHFAHVLEQLVSEENVKLRDVSLLTTSEQQQLIEGFNATNKEYRKNITIPELFEEQVELYGNETAIVFQDEQLTYRELNELSNQFAYYLKSKGLKEETLVPVCMDRSLEIIVAILGILKAGGAYVPIDPAYPAERISYMLEDTGAELVITSTEHRELLAQKRPGAEFICMDAINSLLPLLPSENPHHSITENNLAYVVYTSGSTGLPKGVMIEHKGVINLTYNQVAPLNLRPGIRVFQFASFSFDASCHEIFTTILHGGRLVLAPKETLLDTKLLAELLKKHEIELVTLPPSYQSAIGDEIGGLKTVISAGEALNTKLAIEIQQKGIKLINAYGPTENTVSSILSTDPLHESGCVTIGKPLDNVKACILDSRMKPVPVGVTGELYLGGVQLARGYWNREELTRERFVEASGEWEVASGKSVRMYKTGDLARWLPDGNIEYMGRADDQVKIRGYRVELGEIETVLQQAPGVLQGAVIAKEDSKSIKKLVAYIAGEGLDKETVSAYLKSKLPDYMIPGSIIQLESLPLNNSGKVDRKRLPETDTTGVTEQHKSARNETEARLAEIWQSLLEIETLGINDDFFELGGHSLLAIQLISAIRKTFDKEIAIKDVFDHPTIAGLSEILSGSAAKEMLPVIEATDRPENIPLSFAQERLWFVDRLQGSTQYHMPWIFRLNGAVDIAALKAAFRAIVNRHEILRTTIAEENGVSYQLIKPADQWQLQYLDNEDIHARGITHQDYISEFIAQPFDLSNDSVLRASLISLSEQEHVLVIVLHHIAFDGWSISILVEELTALYRSRVQNSTAVLKKLPVQYADYAIWQRKYLSGDLLERKLAWWKEQLSGVEPLNLQTDHLRAPIQSIKGGIVHRTIDTGLHQRLSEFSKQQGVTIYMTLLCVFKILLHRYTGQTDICVGSPVAGRDREEIEALIGFFVNTVVLRSDISGNPSFEELLQRIRQTTLNAYEHQDVPFEKIVETVGVSRDLSRTPIFQVLFSFAEIPQAVKTDLGGVTLQAEEAASITSKFDLSFTATQSGEELHLSLNYCSDLFNQDTIARMLSHYENILQAALNDVHAPVAQLQMLTESEEKSLTGNINSSATAYPQHKTIIDLFEEQAARTPSKTALVFEGSELSYKQLNERANKLANYLQGKGVKENDLVPVCIGRSLEVMVGILGVLKAGAAYVPVDPDYPQARIGYMIEDTNASVILTSGKYAMLFAELNKIVVCIDEDFAANNNLPSANIKRSITPASLVYVIYTSGSTGNPKGVMIKHNSLVDYVYGLKEKTAIDACDSFALVSTISADLGNTVIYSSLAWGGTLHIFSADTINDPDGLYNYFSNHAIDCVKIVPSHWKALSSNGQMLLPKKMLVFGGEALPSEVVSGIHAVSGCTVVNHYGPTETTIGKLLHVVERNASYEGIVPIGKPFSNTRVYVLDQQLQACPVGVPGELYIAGDGVATGYINNPELTNSRFIKDPFSKADAVMYRTGDQVKFLPDGNILFLGRIDNQVKIRGYRVELGEIEVVLQQAAHVTQCVVIASDDKQGNKRLVGYVVTAAGYDKEATRNYLKAHLPDHMIPSLLLEIDSIPLTANGKIDRKKLPVAELSFTGSGNYVVPRNDIEEKLCAIWSELLGLQQVGVYDNFFDSGGHSLLGIRMISSIRKTFSLAISVHTIFQFTCINDLAKYIDLELNNDLQGENVEVDVLEL